MTIAVRYAKTFGHSGFLVGTSGLRNLLKMVLDALLNRRRLERSNECASGLEHGFKPGVHFFLLNEVAALGCRYSFFHSGKKPGFFVEIPYDHTRNQPLGDGAGLSGNLRKLRFLLGRE